MGVPPSETARGKGEETTSKDKQPTRRFQSSISNSQCVPYYNQACFHTITDPGLTSSSTNLLVSSSARHSQSTPLEDPAEGIDKPQRSTSSRLDHPVMHQDGGKLFVIPSDDEPPTANGSALPRRPPLRWDWEIEHADRKKERKADAALHGATPFEVDRRVLKDVVREKMGVDVGRITFLSAGECPKFSHCRHR